MQYEGFRRFMEQNVFLAFGLVIFLFVVVLGDPLYNFVFSIAKVLLG
jgi:hypothetical protein